MLDIASLDKNFVKAGIAITDKLLEEGLEAYYQINGNLVSLMVDENNMNNCGKLFSFLNRYDLVTKNFQEELRKGADFHIQGLSIYINSLNDMADGKKGMNGLSTFGMFMGQSTIQLNKFIDSNKGEEKYDLLCRLNDSIISPIGELYRVNDFRELERDTGKSYFTECIAKRRTIMPFEYVWDVLKVANSKGVV